MCASGTRSAPCSARSMTRNSTTSSCPWSNPCGAPPRARASARNAALWQRWPTCARSRRCASHESASSSTVPPGQGRSIKFPAEEGCWPGNLGVASRYEKRAIMKTEHSKLPEAASTRRQFIHGAAALGIGIGLGGRASAAAPRRGGTLKLGMGGGSTTDSLDPTLLVDWVSLNQAYMLMNGLVEINEKMEAVPELLESWEAKPGAAEWLLNVRSGVTFHNGKTLDADDVVYSLNLHRGPETRSAVKPNLADVPDVRKSGAMHVTITLKNSHSDLPYLLSDYHLLVVPDGFQDWAKPIGTGPFVFGEYTPGVRSLFKRNPDYWRPNAAWVDAV